MCRLVVLHCLALATICSPAMAASTDYDGKWLSEGACSASAGSPGALGFSFTSISTIRNGYTTSTEKRPAHNNNGVQLEVQFFRHIQNGNLTATADKKTDHGVILHDNTTGHAVSSTEFVDETTEYEWKMNTWVKVLTCTGHLRSIEPSPISLAGMEQQQRERQADTPMQTPATALLHPPSREKQVVTQPVPRQQEGQTQTVEAPPAPKQVVDPFRTAATTLSNQEMGERPVQKAPAVEPEQRGPLSGYGVVLFVAGCLTFGFFVVFSKTQAQSELAGDVQIHPTHYGIAKIKTYIFGTLGIMALSVIIVAITASQIEGYIGYTLSPNLWLGAMIVASLVGLQFGLKSYVNMALRDEIRRTTCPKCRHALAQKRFEQVTGTSQRHKRIGNDLHLVDVTAYQELWECSNCGHTVPGKVGERTRIV